ncbi:TrbI/VirB10 family protein [Legionella sp. W05-934-2]|uniref:TrbI/VirB10 family protein n=1 Tax=Legionella sp. W05-934-2 TaxID=1198649 RepID=UPI003462FB20
MEKDNKFLSADTSPQTLKTTGVKRVNNIPLFIAIGVLTLFVALIAFVAAKRANTNNKEVPVVKLKSAHKNTMSLAQEVIKNQKPIKAILPKESEDKLAIDDASSTTPRTFGLPKKEEMMAEDVPDAEIERIRQEKTQSFEEAVKAKTSISFDKTNTNFNSNMNENQRMMHEPDVASEFKEQLALIQGMQKRPKPMPQTLGGQENEMRWRLNSRLESPNSRYELRAGGVIPGVMISGISSDLPGQIIGQVSQDVYDTATGRYLLIPQGTKLIGIYSSEIKYGQETVLVAWQRLVFPDGKALDIGSMPGGDSAGYAGFRDQVDHHYARIYGSALLMSAVVAGITYSQNINQPNQYGFNQQPTAGSVLSQSLGQQLGEVTTELVKKNLNVAPTINIQPGYRFNVIVIKDLTFNRPYQQFSY